MAAGAPRPDRARDRKDSRGYGNFFGRRHHPGAPAVRFGDVQEEEPRVAALEHEAPTLTHFLGHLPTSPHLDAPIPPLAAPSRQGQLASSIPLPTEVLGGPRYAIVVLDIGARWRDVYLSAERMRPWRDQRYRDSSGPLPL